MKSGRALLVALSVVVALALAAPALRRMLRARVPKLGLVEDWRPGRVAVLPLDGEITGDSARQTLSWLRRFGERTEDVKAIVIALDTPGGAVAPSQEICEEILTLRRTDGIKMVAAMGGMAASGGYYIASACDSIVADPGTVTGSIGVIMESFEAAPLLRKIGVLPEVIKSAEFKDAGSPFRAMTPRDRAVFQSAVNDVYDQFVGDVAVNRHAALARVMARRDGRPASSFTAAQIKAYVKSLADGRIYTGRQAWRLGLVDSLGGLSDAIAKAAALAGLKHAQVITLREPRSIAEELTGMDDARWAAFIRDHFLESAPRLSYLLR